jgi:serine/threonine protein kinase
MIQFKTKDGRMLNFDEKPLSKGGEGAVYKQYDEAGHGDIGDLAKIFFPGKDGGKAEKIAAMLSIGSPNPSYSYTWPKELLYDAATGAFRGYVMYLKPNKKELSELCGYNSLFRKSKDWRFFAHVAKNLAQAVMGVHGINQVIGDLNDNNVLIDENTEVTLIDTDSFHITLGDKKNAVTHRCNVGMSEFIAPEIHGINFREAQLPTFTEHTDNFSLAILVFKLLMNGLHPFNSSNIDDKSIEDNMRNGIAPCFIKAKKGQSTEAPYAPSADMLPPGLRDLFKRAFIDSANSPKKRPSAKEFYDELEQLTKEENIKTCPNDRNHKFPKESSECPWCAVDFKMGCLTRGEDIPADVTASMSRSVSRNSASNNYGDGVTVSNYGDGPSSVSVSFTGATLPAPIPKSRITGAKVVCGLILLLVIAVIVLGMLMRLPWIFLVIAAIAGVIAFLRLPKLDYNNAFDTEPSVPTYMPVNFKQNKRTRFTLVPRPRLWVFNALCIALLLPLIALIILGVFFIMSNLWTFIALTVIGVAAALFIFEKRTLWTKNALGIAIGIVGILAILATFGFAVNLLF